MEPPPEPVISGAHPPKRPQLTRYMLYPERSIGTMLFMFVTSRMRLKILQGPSVANVPPPAACVSVMVSASLSHASRPVLLRLNTTSEPPTVNVCAPRGSHRISVPISNGRSFCCAAGMSFPSCAAFTAGRGVASSASKHEGTAPCPSARGRTPFEQVDCVCRVFVVLRRPIYTGRRLSHQSQIGIQTLPRSFAGAL